MAIKNFGFTSKKGTIPKKDTSPPPDKLPKEGKCSEKESEELSRGEN